MELFGAIHSPNRFTISEGLAFLFKHHLEGKACARPFNSNRKAICRSIGEVYLDVSTEVDVEKHLQTRTHCGPQTRRHDIKLITLLCNTFRRWKRKKLKVGGVDFTLVLLPEDNPTIDTKRPKCRPRTRIVTPNEFSRWIEHCSERLMERSYFALDTGLSRTDLERMTVDWYNPQTDSLEVQRNKSGVFGSIPLSKRCHQIMIQATKEGRRNVLDWVDHQNDYEKTRKASGVYFWFSRDLRKTYYNVLKKLIDQKTLQRAMLHGDPRTGPEHYDVDQGEDLRPAILNLEKQFSTKIFFPSENRLVSVGEVEC